MNGSQRTVRFLVRGDQLAAIRSYLVARRTHGEVLRDFLFEYLPANQLTYGQAPQQLAQAVRAHLASRGDQAEQLCSAGQHRIVSDLDAIRVYPTAVVRQNAILRLTRLLIGTDTPGQFDPWIRLPSSGVGDAT